MPDGWPPRCQLVGYGIQVGAVECQALEEVVQRVAQALLQPLALLRARGGGGGEVGGSPGTWGHPSVNSTLQKSTCALLAWDPAGKEGPRRNLRTWYSGASGVAGQVSILPGANPSALCNMVRLNLE